jgi:hypothetical protein
VVAESRTIYLGLRSNTQYFASRQGFMKLEARLKALALLYDHIVLEQGVYDCAVGRGGSSAWVWPYDDPEQLKPVRTLKRNFRVAVAVDGSDKYDQVINTPTEKRFRAQFESILQQLAPVHPDWVSAVYFDPTDAITRAADDTARRWMWDDSGLLAGFMPEASHFLRDIVIKSLYIDLARAYHLDTDIAPEGMHSKLIASKAAATDMEVVANGERILPLWIPDVRQASWEDIDHLRKDRGISNLRMKLRELDAAGGSDDELLARANREYQDYMERHRPVWSRFVASINWSLFGFTVLAPIAAVAQPILAGLQVPGEKKHWTASFMRVRRYIEDRTEKQSRAKERGASHVGDS